MLEVLFSWGIILGASILFGYTLICTFYSEEKTLHGLDVYIVAGLLVMNVYAEVFSLFYKVGAMACTILFGFGVICGFIMLMKLRHDFSSKLRCLADIIRGKGYAQYLFSFFCIIAIVLWTIPEPRFEDTTLYHIQAVHWIEEYGIVPGLGNLHNRFAYNSAFMPLQALFSLRWLIGNSLHTLNGFVCCVFLVYAFGSNHLLKREKLQPSDFLKFAIIIYICMNRKYISSLSSDLLAMLLVLYLFEKWSEFLERKIDSMLPYSFLCIICVWAITIKLSTAACVLLVLYPAVLMIKRKEWGHIVWHIAAGLMVCMPWLVRNVIISGYLIYPYSGLDFFTVDWKMLPSALDYDRMEICVWGRGTRDVSLFKQPISQWIVIWYQEQKLHDKCLVVIGGISCLALFGMCIQGIRQKQFREVLEYAAAIIAGMMWFFSAPLMRYGSAYLLLPICFVLGKYYRQKPLLALTACLLAIVPLISALYGEIVNLGNVQLIEQVRYQHYETYVKQLDGIEVYIPEDERARVGDDVFPSTPYPRLLDMIELRGEGLEAGFRVKDSYHYKKMTQYGSEWSD